MWGMLQQSAKLRGSVGAFRKAGRRRRGDVLSDGGGREVEDDSDDGGGGGSGGGGGTSCPSDFEDEDDGEDPQQRMLDAMERNVAEVERTKLAMANTEVGDVVATTVNSLVVVVGRTRRHNSLATLPSLLIVLVLVLVLLLLLLLLLCLLCCYVRMVQAENDILRSRISQLELQYGMQCAAIRGLRLATMAAKLREKESVKRSCVDHLQVKDMQITIERLHQQLSRQELSTIGKGGGGGGGGRRGTTPGSGTGDRNGTTTRARRRLTRRP